MVVAGLITGAYSKPVKITLINEAGVVVESKLCTTDYTFTVLTNEAYTVLLQPDLGKLWKPNTRYYAGDFCQSSDVSGKTVYYKCLNDGISHHTEPNFTNDKTQLFPDYQIEWSVQESILPSFILYPVGATNAV